MQLLSDEIKGYLANSSWIRRMFEAGMELKKKYGEDGFAGTIFDVNYKNGKLKIDSNIDNALHFIFSWGLRI